MTVAVPLLPEAEVRAAVHAGLWEEAMELLAHHDRELRRALEGAEMSQLSAAPWRELLEHQTALLGDLCLIRDETARTLARLGRDRRGALAYREVSA